MNITITPEARKFAVDIMIFVGMTLIGAFLIIALAR